MAELRVPQVDFSSLGQLPQLWKQGQQERKLSDLGKMLADGSVDYRTAAAHTADMGDISSTLKFLALSEQEKKQQRELDAGKQFSASVGGMFGGQPGGPGPSVGVPSLSELSPNARAPVPSTPKVWGDAEAEAAGLYEPSKPAVPTAAPVAASPAASPAKVNAPGAGQVPVLIAAISNPNLSADQKGTAKILLAEAFKNMKEPEKIQTLRALQADPSLLDTEMRLKRAGATTVSVGGEKEFDKEFDKGQAKRWGGYIDAGMAARKKQVDIDSMREISQRMGAQGAAADIKEAIGPYAEALGINVDRLSDIQAYSSIIQRLAPAQRAEGSGSTSDIEFKGFIKSLPALSQNPTARDVTLNTMEALNRDEMTRGEIATRLATKEINRKQAEQELRALPDPMRTFTEWRKANPGIYGQAVKGVPAPAAKPTKFTAPEIDQSLSNARAAITANPAARDAILKKLRDSGLPTDGL